MSNWVTLEGQLPSSEIRDVFAESDFYVAPALLESFGIAALEARSAGLPVIGFADSGVADIVTNGHTGLLVDSDEAMVGAMAQLACDPRRLAQLSTAVAAAPPEHAWPSILRRCDEIYTSARAGRGTAEVLAAMR
jgi:glycosyltransferase involved in cell wall biosynthesis